MHEDRFHAIHRSMRHLRWMLAVIIVLLIAILAGLVRFPF